MSKKLGKIEIPTGFLARVLADVFFVNVCLAAALIFRFLVRISWEGMGDRIDQLAPAFTAFYFAASPLLTGLVIGVFYGFGIYNRTRFYARRYKAIVLFQAITLSFLAFAFCAFFFFPETTLVPRSVFLLSYTGTLALSGGSRLLKHFAAGRYEIVERRGPHGKAIRQVLVVGGAGYIGSVLVRELLGRGYQVRVLDAAVYGDQAIDELRAHPRFEFLEGDLRQVEVVARAVKGCDAVIHLGGLVGDPACELNPQSTREINTIATKLLVQVCRGYGVQRLLFASTCAVYGASTYLMDERSALQPLSVYAQTKADAEKVILEAKSKDFCPVVLRLGTAFGHSYRPRFDLVVNLLVAKAARDKKIIIYNKDQWRPFVHVQDIAHAFCLCLGANAEVVSGEIFNVGCFDLNLTLGEVADKIKQELPETKIGFVATDDARNYRVSFDKIHSRLGFVCEKKLEDGVRELRDYIAETPFEVLREEDFDNSKKLQLLGESWLATESDLPLTRLLGE